MFSERPTYAEIPRLLACAPRIYPGPAMAAVELGEDAGRDADIECRRAGPSQADGEIRFPSGALADALGFAAQQRARCGRPIEGGRRLRAFAIAAETTQKFASFSVLIAIARFWGAATGATKLSRRSQRCTPGAAARPAAMQHNRARATATAVLSTAPRSGGSLMRSRMMTSDDAPASRATCRR